MSSKEWEEVKRLAADFQRAQLTVTAQRLTERNCIEIVNKLIELKLLDVVFTTDGKEYVTPQKLSKEILDELFVNGGRLALTDLSTNLNVSITLINTRVTELVKSEKSLHLVLGHLVTTVYLDTLAHDLNEKLSQDGVLSLNEVSKTADLPGDFLNDQMTRRIGKIIKGKQDNTDPSIIYTEAFVRRNTARIRGILSAITKPTPINHIIMKVDQVSEKLFFQIVGKLLASKRIDGIVSAQTRSSYYIPSAYTKSQVNYIEDFMRGNGYIDLDAASRLGINTPKSFIQKRFPEQKIVFLKTCCLGESLFNQVKSLFSESLTSPGWVEISGILPFGATDKDIQILIQSLVNPVTQSVCGTTVIGAELLNTLRSNFKKYMEPSAQDAVESGVYITHVTQLRVAEQKLKMQELNAFEADGRSNKKDDRRKKAVGGKGGGGTQGRETKTKSTKKKYMAGKRNDSDSEEEMSKSKPTSTSISQSLPIARSIEFMSLKRIVELLKEEESLADSSDELIKFIASKIHGPLTEEYQPVLKCLYERDLAKKTGHLSKDGALKIAKRRITILKMFIDGLKEFQGDVASQLEKYLLRTYGNEAANSVTQVGISHGGGDSQQAIPDFMHQCKSVNQLLQDLEQFLQFKPENVNEIFVDAKETLRLEMEAAKEKHDPALFLHLFVLLTFSLLNKSLIQASGKFVPHIVGSLQSKLAPEDFSKLKVAQDAVIANIKSKGSPDDLNYMYDELESMMKAWKL